MLDHCHVDNSILTDGLRGNSRLKSLSQLWSDSSEDASRELLVLAGALRENKGLAELDLNYGRKISDEAWDAVCDSLKTHPALEVLDLQSSMTPVYLEWRIQVLLEMIKVSTSIHTIRVNPCCSEHEMYRESVIPISR
jgi:hypothetical protein